MIEPIDKTEIGPCSTQLCENQGERAHGAQDAAWLASTGVIHKSFYCEGCIEAAGARSWADVRRLRGNKLNAQRDRMAVSGTKYEP